MGRGSQLILVLALTVVMAAAPKAQVEWPGTIRLLPGAEARLLEVARKAGLGEVARVRERSRECAYMLSLETARVQVGRRRAWSEVLVQPRPAPPQSTTSDVPTRPLSSLLLYGFPSSFDCGYHGFERDPVFVAGPIEHREDFAIEDGGWQTFVEIRDGIPYDTARDLVLAFHRQRVRDESQNGAGPLPVGDEAAKIQAIGRGSEPSQWLVVTNEIVSYVVRQSSGRFTVTAVRLSIVEL